MKRPARLLSACLVISLVAGCDASSATPAATTPVTPVATTAVTTVPSTTTLETVPASSSTSSTTAPTAAVMSVIYDDDGSRDGTAALLFLLSNQDVDVTAINISYGEAHPEVYIQHLGRVLESLGIRDIPLGAGQDAPLAPGTAFPDWLRQLSDNFWDYPLDHADRTYPVQSAPELMVTTINESPEPIVIFMSGTFTTLAQALRLDPGIRANIAAVYAMAGAVDVPGNITNLIPDSSNEVAEWNVIADPQAAAEVLDAGLDMYLVPLDSTNQVIFRQVDLQPWHDGDGAARLTADLYDMVFDEFGWVEAEIFDLGAAAIMVEPAACDFEPLHLDVMTDEGDLLGQTVVVPDGEPNVSVCVKPDTDLVMQVLNAAFASSRDEPVATSAEPIMGTWTGTVWNGDTEMTISVTITEACQLGSVCGRFDITTVSCSGALTWVGMDGDMYQFEASEKTAACGDGTDYLLPQADGTVLYVSRGDYGETTGVLQRAPDAADG